MPYKRGTKWIAQIRKDGTRREKIFTTKKEAVSWETEMRKKPAEDWRKKTNTVSLGDWAGQYLDYAKAKFDMKTYQEKRQVFRLFFKHVDIATSVSELKPADVLNYLIKQNEERSGNAANKDRKNLVAAWNWGMTYMNPPLPGPNPCLVKKMPEVRHKRYVPPEDDFWAVYNVAEGPDRIMLLCFLYLGARRGEVFRLKWDDIDFANNRVLLMTRKRKDGSLEHDWLPMVEDLRDALTWWLENRPLKESPYVFVCLDKNQFAQEHYGKPFRYRIHFMKKLCEKAGVDPFGFHAIRHLTASILYNKGCPVSAIQATLRHKSATTTDRYLKTLSQKELHDVLENGFSGSKGKG